MIDGELDNPVFLKQVMENYKLKVRASFQRKREAGHVVKIGNRNVERLRERSWGTGGKVGKRKEPGEVKGGENKRKGRKKMVR